MLFDFTSYFNLTLFTRFIIGSLDHPVNSAKSTALLLKYLTEVEIAGKLLAFVLGTHIQRRRIWRET
ncbi:hypothetical protein CWC08_19100, partial [Pseudoalteromonas ruthenica]